MTVFLKKENLESISDSSSNNPDSASIVVMNPCVLTKILFSDMLSWELALLKRACCDGTFSLATIISGSSLYKSKLNGSG